MHFSVPTANQLLTTRSEGDKIRRQLEEEFRKQRPDHLEVDFGDVKALTISFTDEFLGRFLTEVQGAPHEPIPIMLSGLNEDTAEEVHAVLGRRTLVVAARVDGRLRLLGDDKYLRAMLEEVVTTREATPATLAVNLSITVQNANNRLKRLVDAGSLERTRSSLPGGGREYSYRLPAPFHAATPM